MEKSENPVKKHDLKVINIVFMIYCLCAAGAYGIEAMIPSSGPGLTLVLLMIIPFVWGLPMALASVELGSARPVEGGFYKWIQEALGEFWGFQAGWWKTIANYIDASVYVILAGTYFALMTGVGQTGRYAFQVVIIAIFVIVNLRGIQESSKISMTVGFAVLAIFALITVVGFVNIGGNAFEPFTPPGQGLMLSISGGLAIGIWMYSGYEAMSAVGGEVRNPKIIPKATLIAVPLIAATYILPTAASLGSIGQWENWQEGITGDVVGYGTVLSTYLGHGIWMILFGVIAILAQCSIYNSWMTAGTRVLFAMSDDNLAPKFIKKVNKKYGVPYIPVLIMAVVNLILCSFEFTVVLIIEVLMIIATQILLFISMLVMRKKMPDSERPLKIPGPKAFISIFFSIPVVVGVLAYLLNGTDYFMGGLIGICTGPAAYFVFKRKYGGLHKSDPENHPLNRVTKLAKGDLHRISHFFLVVCALAFMGSLFLPWYEGTWGPEYYLDTYGADVFGTFIAIIKGFAVAGAILFVLFGVIARKADRNERGQ
jgi:amino acid transporter